MEIKHRSVEIPISKRNWFKSQLVSINFVCLHRNVRYFRLHQSNRKKRPNEKKNTKSHYLWKDFNLTTINKLRDCKILGTSTRLVQKYMMRPGFRRRFFYYTVSMGTEICCVFLETRDQWLNQSNSVLSLEWHTKWKKSVFFVANSKYEEEKKFKLNLNDSKWQ